jgi:hypothetical protein
MLRCRNKEVFFGKLNESISKAPSLWVSYVRNHASNATRKTPTKCDPRGIRSDE